MRFVPTSRSTTGPGVERLTSVAFACLVRTLSLLSIEGQRRVGRWLGGLLWRFGRTEVQTTLTNLSLCFPDLSADQRSTLARQSVDHTAMLLTESGALFHWPPERWRALAIEVEGGEILDHACRQPNGALILAPHLGNWEYLALLLGERGITALYDPPRLRGLEPHIRRARNRAGANLLPIDQRGLRSLYQALKDGGLAGLLPDQVPGREAGVYAPFFGMPALTMTFAHRLLLRTRAEVVLAAALRCPGGFRICYRPLDPAIRDPDPVVSATAMNRAIADLVREAPAQYQWDYKRFKRQARGTPDPYRTPRPGNRDSQRS